MSTARLLSSRRIRSTPYHRMVEQHGVSGFTVVNHTLLPKGFGRTVEEDYWHLRKHVQLWDVGCQRQVEIAGPDALKLVQLMTPRNLQSAKVGQCLYAPLVDQRGRMVNDPVILKLAEDRFWLSIADADVALWADGLATGLALDVNVFEADVWPMAVQGPKSDALMTKVFGDAVHEIAFFRFAWLSFEGVPLLVARSGYSAQGGFELYLDRPELGEKLWSALWEAGQPLSVAPGSPNLIERIEAGLVSFGNDMTRGNSPLECGLERFCNLDSSHEFLAREALLKQRSDGVSRMLSGVRFGDVKPGACSTLWPVLRDGVIIGHLSSAAWSPRFETNVALGMVDVHAQSTGAPVVVVDEQDVRHEGTLCSLPMS